MAIAVRAHLGSILNPLTIRALLTHRAFNGGNSREEVGWGRIPDDIVDIVTCSDNSVTVIYQGFLEPTKYLRAPIPIPEKQVNGNVTIHATFCFNSDTDPQDPASYTRSGLDITFRPHDGKFKKSNQSYPDSKAFFRPAEYFLGENELRRDALKWETVLHKTMTMRGSSLSNPVFDIHYVPRLEGQPTSSAIRIPYALVVTIAAPNVTDIHHKVLARYRTYLEVLHPVIEIPIQTRT